VVLRQARRHVLYVWGGGGDLVIFHYPDLAARPSTPAWPHLCRRYSRTPRGQRAATAAGLMESGPRHRAAAGAEAGGQPRWLR